MASAAATSTNKPQGTMNFASKPHDDIYSAARECKALFSQYLDEPRTFTELVLQCQRRFMTWASFLGVFALPMASLDARLQGEPTIMGLTLSMLSVLRRNLERGIRRHAPAEPDSRDPESDGPMRGILGAIDRLHRLAVAIRQPPRTDEVEAVQSFVNKKDPDHFDDVAFGFVHFLFNKHATESLRVQLAKSIIYRRNRLLYERRHTRKLRKAHKLEIEAPTELIPLPQFQEDSSRKDQGSQFKPETEMSPTEPSKRPYQGTYFIHDQGAGNEEPKRALNYAESSNPATAGQYPKPPAVPEGDFGTNCPFCGGHLDKSDLDVEGWWESHIKADLRPYVCISEQCGNFPPSFVTREEWRKHMEANHRENWPRYIHRDWLCTFDHSEPRRFSSEEFLRQHLSHEHSRLLHDADLATALNGGKGIDPAEAGVCPLCGEVVSRDDGANTINLGDMNKGALKKPRRSVRFEESPDAPGTSQPTCENDDARDSVSHRPVAGLDTTTVKLYHHIANHLQYIAFFSLRWWKEDLGVDQDESEQATSRQGIGSNSGKNTVSQSDELDVEDEMRNLKEQQQIRSDAEEMLRQQMFETTNEPIPGEQGSGNVPEDTLSHELPNFKQIEEAESQEKVRLDEKEACLRSLSFPSIYDRLADVSSPDPETCSWFFSTTEYQNWRDRRDLSNLNGVLWIKGKPGTGKSTLMKYVLGNCQRDFNNYIIVAYFFNARGDSLEKTPLGMLRSLFYQLLEKEPSIYDRFIPIFREKCQKHTVGEWVWRESELKHFLLSEIQERQSKPLLLLIDAVDECNDSDVRNIVEFLDELSIRAIYAKTTLNICLSSRHYPNIGMSRCQELSMEVRIEHDEDIAKYVRDKLKTKDEEVIKGVLERASGMFMWVVLVVLILNRAYDDGKVHAMHLALREVPSDFEEMLRTLLSKDNSDKGETIFMLQAVLFTRRPLRPEELYFAMIAGTNVANLGAWNPSIITLDSIRRRITSSSRGLIEVRQGEAETVRFIHKSVEDVLLRNQTLQNLHRTFQLNPIGISHDHLKACCMSYIMMDALSLPMDKLQAKDLVSRYPFLEYSSSYVLDHANEAQLGGVEQAGFLRQLQENEETFERVRLVHNLFENPSSRCDRGANLLHMSSFHGYSGLVNTLLEEGANANAQGGPYGTALQAASARGHVEVVQMLLVKGADVNLEGGRYGTALKAASAEGYEEVVKTLQQFGERLDIVIPHQVFFQDVPLPVSDDTRRLSSQWMDVYMSARDKLLDQIDYSSTFETSKVKVAILDTGIDWDNPYIRGAKDRIMACKDWVDDGQDRNSIHDNAGHGTHVTALLLKIAPKAKVYVCRVADQNGAMVSPDWIAQAIEHAVAAWEVDIIIMSLGFRKPITIINEAIYHAFKKNVILFAATSNDRGNEGVAFPASMHEAVIGVNSTNARGDKSNFNSNALPLSENFSILGEAVESFWPKHLKQGLHQWRSGTSYATIIAAGIAANMLFYIRMKIGNKEKMKEVATCSGMKKLLLSMATPIDGYSYLRPWVLWNKEDEDILAQIRAALK